MRPRPRPPALTFSAVIYKQGINPCVDVPERITGPLQRKGAIPVRGRLDGHPFKSTLVPLGSGKYRLYINGAMRKTASVDVGDRVKVALEVDTRQRTVPMPAAFSRALDHTPGARARFEELTASRRKDILLYMNALKRPESLQKVIDRVLKSLMGDK